jgi:hypothetical protein
VRGFNSTFQAAIQITNTNDTLNITQLSGARENFDIEAFLPSTSVTYGRVVFRYTGAADLQQGLDSGASASMMVQFEVLVPREACSSYPELCVEVIPGLNASYQHPVDYTDNVRCLSTMSILQCDGE